MTVGHPVTDAWRVLARHAEACGPCAVAVARLARVPADPQRQDMAEHEGMCPEGRETFSLWWGEKHELLEATTGLRRRQFLMRDQLWDDGVGFEARAAAIMSMPGPAFAAWLVLPDVERRNQLRALEARAGLGERTVRHEPAAGQERAAMPRAEVLEGTDMGERAQGQERAAGPERAGESESTQSGERAGTAESADQGERVCASPECQVRFVPAFPRQRFHSGACRAKAARRSRLEVTE